METIVRDTIQISTQLSLRFLEQGLSYQMMGEIHAYLTPYIRSNSALFNMLKAFIRFLSGNNLAYLSELEDLERRYILAGRVLLRLYRELEDMLNINTQDSPISVFTWE